MIGPSMHVLFSAIVCLNVFGIVATVMAGNPARVWHHFLMAIVAIVAMKMYSDFD